MTCLRSRMAVLGLALALIAPAGAGAIVAGQGDGTLESLAFVSDRLSIRSEVEPIQEVESLVQPEVRQALADFRKGADGEWAAYVDRRTGLVESMVGAGIPWIPGRGNQLTLDDIAANLQGSPDVDLATLERIARGFLPRVAPLLGIKPAQLVLNRDRSNHLADYLWRVDFDLVRGGLTVEGAYVAFTVNHGNLIQIEAENIPAPGTAVPGSRINRARALSILADYVGGFSGADWFLDGGSMRLLPVAGADGKSREIVPAWQFTFHREGSAGTWRARVDAVKGEVLELLDLNDYANAYVRGGVMFQGTESTRPMPNANAGGGFANSSGVYNFTAATNSTLNGQFVRTLDNCGAINEPSAVNGDIDFGISGGSNCTTPGHGGAGNTRSSRTQFYHLGRAKDTARGWFPANAWVNAQLTANVNINSTCNAFWHPTFGTVNFYRSGGGCGNTGEIEEVSLHEYGHGFDQNDGNGSSIDKGTGETYGDFTAALVSHTSCIGDGFRTTNCGGYGDPCLSCTGVRDIDWAAHTSGTPHTVANFTQTCPNHATYRGPCLKEGHCESYVSSEALWDLAARDLPSPGTAQAWATADRLWYLSRPSATKAFICVTGTPFTSHGCGAGTYWRAMQAVDDDDGNLANGTPNGGALYAAFNRHLIACTTDPGANVTFAGCTPPSTPTVTLTPGDDQATVSWTSSGAGVVYDVFRNDLGCAFGMAKVANNVAGTSFVDTTVANDVTYSYLVVAHGSGNEACAAQASACQDVTPRHRTDVWSKDKALPVPEDTGNEPEVPLFGYPMWQSPDLWVRKTNTAGPHENPEFGQVNYVKVNVRNRSTVTAINVPVKVYYANASAGLAWPIDWTLIGTSVIANLPGGATTTITLPWSPPGTGHYCLLSRLDTPQDPMTFAETTSVDYNTRYNNNIVWKNVNVVDLLANIRVPVRMIFRNPDLFARRIRLILREPRQQLEKPFLRRGTVQLTVPDKLIAKLEEQGIEPVNLKRVDVATFELTDPEGGYFELDLDAREEFDLGILFANTAPPTTGEKLVAETYTFEVVEQDADTDEEIGGVAYLIDAPQI